MPPRTPYTTIDLSFPDATDIGVSGINNQGEIVGSYYDLVTVHGFFDDKGIVSTLDVPGAFGTFAQGINDRGQIVGTYLDSSSQGHGFIATPKKKKE